MDYPTTLKQAGVQHCLPLTNPYANTIVQEQCENAFNEPAQNLEPPLFMLHHAFTSLRKWTNDNTSTEGSKKPK